MKEYTTDQIRNIALAGHMGAGKTTLAEALLFRNKHTERLLKVDDGNSTSDYDPEEIARNISINAAVLPLECKEVKINLLDLPGNRDFLGEIRNNMRATEGVCLVIDASSGVEVGTEYAYEVAEEFGLPCFALVTKMDKERADYQKVVDELTETLGKPAVPVVIPIGDAESYSGVIDLFKMKALTEDASGKVTSGAIPAELRDAADEARAALVEAAAEGDDDLTMKFLEDEPLTDEEVLVGLRGGLNERRFVPVLCGAGVSCSGVQSFLDFVSSCMPSPADATGLEATQGDDGDAEPLPYSSDGSPLAYVFKSIADDFAGRLSFFKIVRGFFSSDSTFRNLSKGKDERISHLLSVRGKKQENVHKMAAGDIGCVAKAPSLETYDTIGDPSAIERVVPTSMPSPICLRAVRATNKSDSDKLSMSLHRLTEQDPTILVERNPETHETIIGGMGETHVGVAAARLKAISKVDVAMAVPRVAYRETIRGKGAGQYRHKKQSGGRGQFAEVHMRLEPNTEGAGLEFLWEVVGGNIPTNYSSACEKGIMQALERGIVAGYTVIDIKAIVHDGKYHDVDSSDMAFMIAAAQAFRSVAQQAQPIILEPIAIAKVTVPEANMGDVMGDFSSKRGRVLGSSNARGKATVEAQVPMAEMFEYSRELRSMTGGRGVFELTAAHYEPVPREIQQQLIAEHEKAKEEDD